MATLAKSGGSSKVILSLRDIHKTFGGIHALAGVSFDLREGEVHALVGENGAGKSTLIKVITGAYTPDAGVIEFGGVNYNSLDPELARQLGVGAVYQEFNLLPELSVSENICLGAQPLGRYGLIDTKNRTARARELLERLGAHVHIDPGELVKHLTVGEQQIVEIAKALAINAHILIMDEPSAVLPSRDLDRLFAVIRTLRSEGHGIIYISHRLNEIFELADRVTVLKDGQTMATKDVADTNNDELVSLMVGRSLTDMYPPRDNQPGDLLLEARDLCIEGTVFDVAFQVHAGEVVGMAGLGGSGRTTVCRTMVGLGKVKSGQIQYLNQSAPRTPAAAAQAGLVLIPEDRKAYGLVLNQTTRFNLALPNLTQFLRVGVLNARREKEAILKTINDVQIKPPSPDLSAENLSGGNQQKVVVGKWLLANPKLVIFDEPTRGIDVGAKAEIYLRIRELTRQGVGVIMASSELPELIGMSDRILVFHEGRIVGELTLPEFSEEAIMHLATASHLAQAQKAVDTSIYKKEGPYTIAVLQQDVSNGWGQTYNVTMQAFGSELLKQGVLAKPLLSSSTNDAERQVNDLASFIEQKPDAIVIEPLDRVLPRPMIKRALETGIPVVLCANGIEGEDFTAHVDIDFYKSAYTSGKRLADLLGGKGNVVVFNGIAGADSTVTWRKAALDALNRNPEIHVVAEEYAQWNVETAKQKMAELLKTNPKIDGVWAGGGEMALGAAKAFLEVDRPLPKFAMVNVPNGFLHLAKENKIEFVVAPDPPAMARYGLQTAIDVLQGKPMKKFINVQTQMAGAEVFDHNSFEKWYVPELNDDFVPPASVDIQYYREGGLGRVSG
jgi:ABC-type sugar transport system ATPase subunit/DNA-binding LacI/PurR family transcriptional regulator